MCSFQKPEPWQPSHQWPMPSVPIPEECELEETRYLRRLQSDNPSDGLAKLYSDIVYVGLDYFTFLSRAVLIVVFLKERTRSPIAIKLAKEHDIATDGTVSYMYWMQARDIPKYEAPFQKVS